MRITIYNDWNVHDYYCGVTPNSEYMIGFTFESIKSNVLLSRIPKKGLFLIELWGGEGPSRNEFHITDNEKEAFESFKEFVELCSDSAEEGEVSEANKILVKAKEMLKT